MTQISIDIILAEELARVELSVPAHCNGVRLVRFDAVLPGFGVRHYPSGRKVYMLQTRMDGRQRAVTIGDAAVISEHAAKDVARRIILRAELGLNPAEAKQAAKQVPEYRAFLAYYWQVVAPTWKPSTRETQDIYRRTHLEEPFKGRFIDEITPAEAIRWHAMITRSSGPGAANRAVEIAKAAFNKAEQWGFLPEYSNPFNAVRRNRPRKFERFLSADDMARLGRVLAETKATHPQETAIVQLLALTGCRRNEIAHLQWSEVKGRKLKLTDSKAGPRIVWLDEEAQAILRAIPKRKGSNAVFHFDCMPESRIAYFWNTVRERAELGQFRLHDLRHNYASFAARTSETLPVIGKLLGHSSVGTTQRYAHLDDETLLAAVERVICENN